MRIRRHLDRLVRALSEQRFLVMSAFLVVLPFVVPYTTLATNIVIYGLYALGFNLVFGHAGLLSLGHAAFFGGGAYGFGIAVVHFGANLALALGSAILLSVAIACAIGMLVLRSQGIYFAMITLALANCVYYVFFKAARWTGGETGLHGAAMASIALPHWTLDLQNPLVRYYVVLALALAGVWLVYRVLDSPLGSVLAAIRVNENRAAACGYDVKKVRLLVIVLSASICGLAGALHTLNVGTVPIDVLHYWTSSQVLMMAILGGSTTFAGPFVGAFLYALLSDSLAAVTAHWQLYFGLLFLFFVRFFPRGVWGTLTENRA